MKKKGLVIAAALLIGIFGGFPQAVGAEQKTQTAEERVVMAPSGISKDSSGRMYMADRNYHVLRRRNKDGKCVTLAGTEGKSGSKNASGKKAAFNRPTGLAVGKEGELYIADTGNNLIRVMDKNGKVTTYAGGKKGCADGKVKSARFCEPTGLCYYKGALYVADSGNHRICKIAGGKVTTVAGSKKGIEGDAVGNVTKSRLSNPQEIYWYKDVMYISDTGNGSVKKLRKGKVSTVVKAFSQNDGRAPAEPCGLVITGGCLYVGDIFTEDLIKTISV